MVKIDDCVIVIDEAPIQGLLVDKVLKKTFHEACPQLKTYASLKAFESELKTIQHCSGLLLIDLKALKQNNFTFFQQYSHKSKNLGLNLKIFVLYASAPPPLIQDDLFYGCVIGNVKKPLLMTELTQIFQSSRLSMQNKNATETEMESL